MHEQEVTIGHAYQARIIQKFICDINGLLSETNA
jgi:hypothetical protein